MTVLGVSSLFVHREEELVEQEGCRGLIRGWKVPYRPSLARADEIPVFLSLRRNEVAEKFWRGEAE
eukprot:728785-Hanusia_phi.AAC.1